MTTRPGSSRLPLALWWIACMAVAGAIVAGLITTGGPQAERMRRMDSERTFDLEQLQAAIASHYLTHRQLPDSLASVTVAEDSRRDPATQQPYGYRKLNASGFQLCATFELESQHLDRQRYPQSYRAYEAPSMQFSSHPKGRHCFRLEKTANAGPTDAAIEFTIR